MTSIDMTVIYNQTNPTESTMAIKLSREDKVEVRLTTESFPPGARIDKVTLFENVLENGVGEPGGAICSWTRGNDGDPAICSLPDAEGNPCGSYYGIKFGDATHVTLTDIQKGISRIANHRTHWFGISGTLEDGGSWSADPELINRPDGN